jgi:hypothetical protein
MDFKDSNELSSDNDLLLKNSGLKNKDGIYTINPE